MSTESGESKEVWLARYKTRVEALEVVRAQELAAMTEPEALRKIMSLRLFSEITRTLSDWSGLVIQQAILHRKPIP